MQKFRKENVINCMFFGANGTTLAHQPGYTPLVSPQYLIKKTIFQRALLHRTCCIIHLEVQDLQCFCLPAHLIIHIQKRLIGTKDFLKTDKILFCEYCYENQAPDIIAAAVGYGRKKPAYTALLSG